MRFDTPLPIDEALPSLLAALAERNSAVLVAPPGAGKTTRVPLAMIDAPWLGDGKILVLEPRRLAARAAAERMAKTLGQGVGGIVGLRARLLSKVSAATRIEVVTEGVFTRMILDDPSLDGVGAVLFDEFHERSLDADLGLALALDAQSALRDDVRILVMSATLEGGRVAALLGDAPLIQSEGRSFPVETRYVGRDGRARIEDLVTDGILKALRAEPGSILAFLPGQGEIRRVADRLAERIGADQAVDIVPLYGAMDIAAQRRAIEPAEPGRRKIVLATSIAETSITIEGVRVVVDCGLARVPRFEPDVGVTRLETVRVSRAAADQRRGRAGRTEPGVCYRLWDKPQTASLPAYAEPEIRNADLSPLLLDCAAWGVTDPASLRWLDLPPVAAIAAAREELGALDAIDPSGRLTDAGKAMRELPLPPRLARMLLAAARGGAAREAAEVAAVLVERGLGGNDTDLDTRLTQFRRDRSRRAEDMRRLAAGWASSASQLSMATRTARDSGGVPHSPAVQRGVGQGDEGGPRCAAPFAEPCASAAALLALAFPERIAKARGAPGQFLLANGRAAALDATDALARSPFLVVAELQGKAASTRILLAARLDEGQLLPIAGARIVEEDEVAFDLEAAALRARRVRRLGAIVLVSEPRSVEPGEAVAVALADAIARIGIARLPWTKHQRQLRDRVGFLRKAEGNAWPDLSDHRLASSVRDWLAPFLDGKSRLADVGADDLAQALDALLTWDLKRRLDAEAPTHFEAPTGNRHPIDYDGPGAPALSIRVQELFGLKEHPAIAGGKLPLTLNLLSPAQRPIQITRDLPGFWKGSWAAVKADMKGRYPKHPWPEDPADAAPTARAKPRGK